MQRLVQFVAGAVLGVAFGVSVGLLLAPRSGEDTRRLVQERVEAVLEEGRQAAAARREELAGQFEALKQPVS